MTVTLEHHGIDRVVVHGVDTTAALAHLCHSLEVGAGPDARVVVIDLTDAPLVAQAATTSIGAAAQALAHSHRWLGVVEPVHAVAAHEADAWYATTHSALAAGDRYLSFVTGARDTPSALRVPLTAAADLLFGLPGISMAIARGLWRRLLVAGHSPLDR